MNRFVCFVFLFSYVSATFAAEVADLIPDSKNGQSYFLIKRGFWAFPLSARFYSIQGKEILRFLAIDGETRNNEFIEKEKNDYQPTFVLNNLDNKQASSAVELLIALIDAIKTYKKVLVISSSADLYILHIALEKLYGEPEFTGVKYISCSLL